MDKLIVGPLIRSQVSTVIMIDALDECTDCEPASAILSVLGQFVAGIQQKAKFFVTGRPEPRIQKGFRLLVRTAGEFVLHEVKPTQVDRDIRLFFRHKLMELGGIQDVVDVWPTEEQLNTLCDRAGGFFVYAMATVRFVAQKRHYPKEQLDLLLQSPGSKFEGSTRLKEEDNQTLDSLYISILLEAFGDDDPKDNPDVRSTLGAVVLAINPLSPSAIAALMDLDPGHVFRLLSSVRSLLVLGGDVDQPVRPFHKSFTDFIVDSTRCGNPRFHFSPPDQHAQLVVGCLELMNRTLEKNMCHLPEAVLNSDISDMTEKTKYINQALQYACRSWHVHFTHGYHAASKITSKITVALREFLETKFLFWLEVLSVLGSVRNAVDALQAVVRRLEVRQIFVVVFVEIPEAFFRSHPRLT